MNSAEREVYDKYVYTDLSYIFMIYIEFERRANHTEEEFEDLKTGECRFDYASWEKRLDITHKKMVNGIKKLSEEDMKIKQIFKGVKGKSSKYYLLRYEEQKKEQNKEQNEEQNKCSNTNGLSGIEEQNKEQNEEQNKEHTSIYSNQYIKSNNIYKEKIDEIWSYYLERLKPLGITRKKTENKIKHIRARLAEGFTIEDLKNVIDNVFSNEWMLGNNEQGKMYIEIDNFMCNTEKVEKWNVKKKSTPSNNEPDTSWFYRDGKEKLNNDTIPSDPEILKLWEEARNKKSNSSGFDFSYMNK